MRFALLLLLCLSAVVLSVNARRSHHPPAGAASVHIEHSGVFNPLWYRLNGASLVGNELASFNSSTVHTAFQCAAYCGALSATAPASCVGFTFDASSGCSLFSSIDTMVQQNDPTLISGAMPPKGGATILLSGYDLFGSDVHTTCGDTSTIPLCEQCCVQSGVCNSFSFDAGACYPKAFNVSGLFYNRGGNFFLGLMPFNFGVEAQKEE